MGLLQKLGIRNKYETGANYELGNSLSATAVSSLFGKGGQNINVLEEYAGIAWKCIDVRAELLADQDLWVEKFTANKWQQDTSHEFNQVLEGGDGQNDLSELLEAHEKSMCLYGESFWYFSKLESSRKPFAVYLLDPNCMTVMVSGQKVTSYIYQKDGVRILFDLDEIAHYKIYDWRHPFRGTGPMQSAGWFIRSSRYTMTFVNNFLENNAIPAGVIVAKGQVNDGDWELFKSQWASRYGGIDSAGKTGYIRGQDLDFVKTGMSLGEVDFDKVKKADREDIMVMFGVSKPMMAIFDDINRASAVTARQLAAITLTSPALKKIKRKLSKKFIYWYNLNALQYRIGSTNPIPEDEDTKLQVYDKGVGRFITVNEARAAYGFEPIDGGDVIDTSTKATSQQAKTFSKEAKRKVVGTIKVKSNNKVQYDAVMKESFRSNTEDLQIKYEARVIEAASKVLKQQKADVIDQLIPRKLHDSTLDVNKEAETLTAEIAPIIIDLAQEQGILAALFVGTGDIEFKVDNLIKDYIRNSIHKSTVAFTAETQEKVATTIAEGLQEGESLAKLAKRIDVVYENLLGVKSPGYRTERLARTEVIKASNEITEVAYKNSGVVTKKEWFANPGRCEFCAALDGSIISLGASFVPVGSTLEGAEGGTRANDYENVEHPPVHPACRCTLIPVIES